MPFLQSNVANDVHYAANSWLNGASFKSGLQSGGISAGIGAVTGGLVGGICSGISATRHNAKFWSGKFNENNPIYQKGCIALNVVDGKPVEATDDFLLKAQKEWFPDASIENVKAGDTIEVSCLISTSYGTRIKSIKLIGGNQKIEMKDMSTNWRAQIISQKYILTEEDIVNGQVRIGLCFTEKDETSTSGGWMYLDDFHLEYLEKIYPKE